MARFSVTGSSCSERAMVGSALEITVESSVCMKRAQPMIIGASAPAMNRGRSATASLMTALRRSGPGVRRPWQAPRARPG